MPQLIYNHEFIAENNFTISPSNRAFLYGDGLFETMIYREGRLLYAEDHWQRISTGLALLDIQLPASLSSDKLSSLTSELVKKNNLHQNARIKWQVWRKPGGLVTPESNSAEFIITANELKKNPEVKTQAFFSEKIKLVPGNLSRYKTLNFLPYIQAGLEKKKRKADEIILTDLKGNIAETTTCNIFWCKDDVLYTPSLDTGCIEGIMRKQIMRFCQSENIKVQEGFFQPKELDQAELIFTSNVNGLSLIEKINDKKINTQYTLYQAIRIGLDLL
ncbi:MAG TPA: aminotransferase class IV [Cytophagaceae bacterium]|nr:aminotransferase class IV [Cytophagaceae bacterium]